MGQRHIYTEEQIRYIYRQYLLEQARVVHRIFDNVINFTRKFISNVVVSDTYPEFDFFTGFVYDSNNFICKPGDEKSYHPIYIKFDNEPEQAYEAYIPTRVVRGVENSVLEHDSIVIHLNVPTIRMYAFGNPSEILKRIPSLLAHELTHARDMWTSDYVNIIDNLIDLGYNAVTKKFLEEEHITGVSKNVIDTVNSMLYFMSPAETNAIYEGYDKYLKYLSDGQLIHLIGNEFGSNPYSNRQAAARIFAMTKDLAHVNNRGMYIRLEDYAQSDDYTIPVLFTAFAVYLGFIPDSSGYFEDFSIAKEVIEGNVYPDDNMTKMMVSAFLELEIKFGEYVADMEDLISDVLEERSIFEKIRQTNIDESTVTYPLEHYVEKLEVYGQLTEMESPFQKYMRLLTDLSIPSITAVLEKEYAGKKIEHYHIIGQR